MTSPIDELSACIVEEEGTDLRQRFEFGRGANVNDPLRINDVGHVIRPAGALAALRWFQDRSNDMPTDPAFLARELDFWGACGDVIAAQWVFARMLKKRDLPPAIPGRDLRREADRWCANAESLVTREDDIRVAFAMLRDDLPHGEATPVLKTQFTRAVPLADTALCLSVEEPSLLGPREVPQWLRDLDMTDLALCGGAALWLAAGFRDSPSDWDIFACNGEESWAEAERAIAALCALPHETLVSTTGAAVTVMVFAPTVVKVQFVRRTFASVSEVLESFDLDFCRVALYRDQLIATPRGHRALETMHSVMTPETWSSRFVHRAAKYASRGFAVRLPGLQNSRGDPMPPGDASPVDSTLRQFRSYANFKVIDAQPDSYESDSRLIHLAYSKNTLGGVVTALRFVDDDAVRFTTSKNPDIRRMLAEIPEISFRRWEGAEDEFFAQPRGEGRDCGFSFQTMRWGSQRFMYVHEDFVTELTECTRDGHEILWTNPRDPESDPMEIAIKFEGLKCRQIEIDEPGEKVYVFEHHAITHVARVLRTCLKNARWLTYRPEESEIWDFIDTNSDTFAGVLNVRIKERIRLVKIEAGKRAKYVVLWRDWKTIHE